MGGYEYQDRMENVGLYTHPRNCFLSNPPQQVVDEKRIGDENQRRLCFIQPIHYRARGQYVFEGKKSGRHLFLIKKKNYQTLIGMIMTQILHQIFFVTFLESNYCQNHGQCSENKGLRKH